MKKMVTGVLALVMVLVMVGCGQKDNGVVNGVAKDGATIGEGAKSFTMEVVDKDGGKVTFTVKTDADTVGKALLDQGVIAGEDSSYGLYVKTVNGITLDYDTDGMYWAFYINLVARPGGPLWPHGRGCRSGHECAYRRGPRSVRLHQPGLRRRLYRASQRQHRG